MVMNRSNDSGSCDGTVCRYETTPADFIYPSCRSYDFSTWAFPHPSIRPWVANPRRMVNEFLLGQRIPKIIRFFADCGSKDGYVRCLLCSGCNRYREEAIWTGGNGFRRWLISRQIEWPLRKLGGARYRRWEQCRTQQSSTNLEALRKSARD